MCTARTFQSAAPAPPPTPEPTATSQRAPAGQTVAQRRAAAQGTAQLRIPLPRINAPAR